MATFQRPPLSAAGSLDQQTLATPSTNDQPVKKAVQAKTVEANANSEVSPVDKKTLKQTPTPTAAKSDNKPAGVVSHVVVAYNQQGKTRIKFMDNRNNVVYQIPSEMVAKIEDLMMKPETSTDVKG
jgi:hypothetical protein